MRWTWLLLLVPCLLGQAPPRQENSAPPRAARRQALLICGLPGDDEHRKLFTGTVEKLYKALSERYGFAASDVMVRFGVEKVSGDGPALSGMRGLSNREGLAADIDELRKRLLEQDTLWVIVLGHTYYDGRHSHLNIPGPDLDEPRIKGKSFEGLCYPRAPLLITTPERFFHRSRREYGLSSRRPSPGLRQRDHALAGRTRSDRPIRTASSRRAYLAVERDSRCREDLPT